MKLIVTALILHLFTRSEATEDATNKTKRTIGGQVHNYGENRPVLLYHENSGGPIPPQQIAAFYAPGSINPEMPKQVAAQHVLYEFQQSPTNAVSNVHVNQFYQPLNNKQESAALSNTGPAQFISGSESVATPVQHSSLIRHGQNYAQVQYPLPGPQHTQTQHYVPGKYLYVNGKIVYQPNQQQYQPNQQQYQPNQQQNGGPQQKPVSYLYTNPQIATQRFLTPPPLIRPVSYRRFQPPLPHQIQQITKPVTSEAEEQNEEEAPEEENNNKEEEVEEEEQESDDEYEDEGERYFGKYMFDEDEEEDRGNYKEEEEDEDSERGSSRTVPRKQKKKPSKYNKSNNFKYAENYSSSSKYEKPVKKGKKPVKNPKMHYKSVKYSREGSGKPRIEKVERIEGKQSQNVPVVHKQKIFKEKWYVTKSTDDSSM